MQFSKELLKGNLEIIVLKAISDAGSCYGYQMLQVIADESGKIFEFAESSLYPLLYRLESQKLIQSERRTAPSGKERRYYELTEAGKGVLAVKQVELENLVTGLAKIFKFSLNV